MARILMPIPSGTKLGPYEIVASVGAGGMGEVYRARDHRLGREVAVKVLPALLTRDAERLRRFEQEARAAAALNHPNILAVFDIGTHDDSPYLVTELLEGETLRERMQSRALSARKAVDYAQQIARGLVAAHDKGILHRDLKPENIFITSNGQVKILDFGLAKLIRPEGSGSTSDSPTLASGTAAGIVLGTVGYMSPEQVRGLAVDARSDLFSLGTILYEMVSGRRAFGGDTPADTMSAILREEPPPLSDIQQNIPPGLARIVEHCLEKNPADRFQSARDVAFALDAFSGSSSSKVAALSAPEGAGFWQKRVELIAAVASVAAIVLFFVGRSTAPTVTSPTYHQLTFQRGTIYSARFAPDGETVVYAAAWNAKPIELFSMRTDSTDSRPLGLTDTDLLSISSGGELAVRTAPRSLTSFQTSGTLGRTALTGGLPRPVENEVQAADWAPDGKSGVIIRDVGGQQRMEFGGKVLYSTPGWISNPRFSPDGTKIAFVSHQSRAGDPGKISILNVSDGKVTDLATDFVSTYGLAWPPRGDEVWFTATRTGSMRLLYGVSLRGKERVIASIPGVLTLQDISKSGRVLLSHDTWRLGILALAPGKDKEQDLSYQDYSAIRGLSPDGKTLLFDESGEAGGGPGVMFLRPMDGSPPLRLGDGTSQALSRDGKWVMAVTLQGLNEIVIIPTGTGETRRLPRLPFNPHWGDWLVGDNEFLLSGGEAGHANRLYRANVATGAVRAVSAEGVTPVPYAQIISPDGKSVLAFGPDGSPAVFSTENGERKPIPGMEAGEQPIGWTADGASIYVYRPTVPARIFRVELATGKRQLWKELTPADPVGVYFIRPPHIAADGKSYAYNYGRILSDLYVADGLR
jgi:serine/threonine protein kinase/Tol biopolymer transport system component